MKRALVAAAVLAAAACGASSPTEPELGGTWSGVLTPSRWFRDELTLTVTQSGAGLSGRGVRGIPCPADGQCWTDATIAGRVEGETVTFALTTVEPGWNGTFRGRRQSADRIEGTFTNGFQESPVTLTRTPF